MNFLGVYGVAPKEKVDTSAKGTPATAPHVPDVVEVKHRALIVVPRMLDAATIHAELEKRLPEVALSQSDVDIENFKKVAAAVAANQTLLTRLKNHTAFKNPEIMAQLVK
jgi:hypothetical protein